MRRGSPDLHFNPRPPRGERRRRSPSGRCCGYFNPRPPRGERQPSPTPRRGESHFNPRPPRGERLALSSLEVSGFSNFNPRPPRGERPVPSLHLNSFPVFQSTPSARRATVERAKNPDLTYISIHALREESDGLCGKSIPWQKNFNPRPPRGERPGPVGRVVGAFQISIHALREESDSYS